MVVIAKMIILVHLNDESLQICHQMHLDICQTLKEMEELSEVYQHVMFWGASTTWRRDVSAVFEAESALQAVEMGLLQDPVDLQVRSRVSGRSQVWGVTGADGRVGVCNTPAGAARSSMLRRADAALAQRGLKMQKSSISDAFNDKYHEGPRTEIY